MSSKNSKNNPEDPNGHGNLKITKENIYLTPEEEINKWRRFCGYGLIIVSVLVFLVIAFSSGRFIEKLEPKSLAPHVFDYVRLSARAILTAAVAVFAYKLLRAGERMILPLTMVKNTDDLKLVLGFNRLENMDGVIKSNDLFKALIDVFKSRASDSSK